MTLTLTVRNVAHLDNGMPTELVLNRRGAMIGRSPTCDWSLPDPANFISSRHCEIRFENDGYVLQDISTNGTILNGARARMTEPRRIATGDRFTIGHYEVEAALSGQAAANVATGIGNAASTPEWGGWERHGGGQPAAAAPPAPNGWDSLSEADGDWQQRADEWDEPAGSGASGDGWGPPPGQRGSASWEPPAGGHDEPQVRSPWAQAAPAASPASDWSSAAPDRAPQPTPNDVWGAIAEGHVVDWARGNAGAPRRDPFASPATVGGGDFVGSAGGVAGWAPPALPRAEHPSRPAADRAAPNGSTDANGWGAPPAAAPAEARQTSGRPDSVSSAVGAMRGGGSGGGDALLAAAGLDASQTTGSPAETLARAGRLLRHLVAGLVVMVEARARAKAQMGAEATSFAFAGNNPLKFARTPEQALAQLLNEPERGFMNADDAIDDAYRDLQSHQIATLKAMQGALRATLDRFSPAAIKRRADAGGLLARLPGAREKALWQAYEREFGGVVRDSDEAFMQVFAKEFRHAYEEHSRAGR